MGIFQSVSDSPKPKRKFIVFLEGNISAGKSTIIDSLRELHYDAVPEGMEKLKSIHVDGDGKNILQLFYDDMKSYGYKMQIAVLDARIKNVLKALKKLEANDNNGICFVERSPITDSQTFALNLLEQGHFSEIEWSIYDELVTTLCAATMDRNEDIQTRHIYVRTDPQICHARMTRRDTPEEKRVPLEYLQKIHEYHENWLNSETSRREPIYIVDGNGSKDDVILGIIDAMTKIQEEASESD